VGGIGNYPYLVHYVWTGPRNAGECRPAAVVREWPGGVLNLAVFPDGTNDGEERMAVWATSATHGTDGTPGTWHHARECSPDQGATEPSPVAVEPTPTGAESSPTPTAGAALPPEELWSIGDQPAYAGGDAE